MSAAGFRVHNPAAPQASSTPAGRSKGKINTKATDKINSQIKGKINNQVKGKINNQVKGKIKNCDEEPAPPAGALGSLGELARFHRVAGSGPCGGGL
ncbi:hypothetical protein [Catenulispora pinisilvae]|uniref:hypothetical protein n=1 Tax=Catenulispora pinisilvae TaxID=2705253 RepID=UPI001891F889|nr:hypothetical protein [Catenulispora pinisilvae]